MSVLKQGCKLEILRTSIRKQVTGGGLPKKTGELIEFLFQSLPETNITPEKRPRSVSLKETSRGYLQSFHFCFELDRILTYGFFLDSSPKVLDSSNRRVFRALLRVYMQQRSWETNTFWFF